MVKGKPKKQKKSATKKTGLKTKSKKQKKSATRKINLKPKSKKIKESFDSPESETIAVWNKNLEKFEKTAEEISRDHDFIVLGDNKLREKYIKKNYPNEREVKRLLKRAMELYIARVKKFSI